MANRHLRPFSDDNTLVTKFNFKGQSGKGIIFLLENGSGGY
jgi:hypothetical protein